MLQPRVSVTMASAAGSLFARTYAGVAIGALIQGQTDHDDLLGHSVARALLDLQIRTGKPIGLGITGPGMSHAVAMRRIGNAGRAVDAAVAMIRSKARGKRNIRR